MSFFTWLDYSEHERQRMQAAIDLFGEQDTRDELGIGAVRDAFADLFFPGTSTIQTRASYFLFVPWMYQELERLKVPSSQIMARARRDEIALIEALVAAGDSQGTFGIDARGKLKRLASNVYWQGLGVWGIRVYPGSQTQYHRSLDGFYRAHARALRNDDGEWVDVRAARNWHGSMPTAPNGFPQVATHRLRPVDAEYLRERIATRCPASLLAYLLTSGWPPVAATYAWDHPYLADLPVDYQGHLLHARNFSEAIHGAALLYNLLLAEKSGVEPLVAQYRHMVGEWAGLMQVRGEALLSWDRQAFWSLVIAGGAHITMLTRHFIDRWLDLTLTPRLGAELADAPGARQIIADRERLLKRTNARLQNQRALEQWANGGAAAGTGRLVFRWPVAQRMISDILDGLEGDHDA